MTREEFINWFEERFVLNKNNIYEFGQLYDEVTNPHWISVEDEYPKEEQLVLACNAKGFFMPAKYSDGIWWFYWNFKSQLLDVVYWMPMPTLPNDYLAEVSKEAHRIVLEKQPKGGEE